uniref:Uncharacterized protein LOC104266258 n=1 Tax=Phallusia mammillata TaxID=59560 RepID=A0A6F9DJK6_9ASCI|nr:uncharacterized protein LOC104266258 [Phallusia mammillata]
MKTLLVLCSLVSVSMGFIFGGGGFPTLPGFSTTCKLPSRPYQSYVSPTKPTYKFGEKIKFYCLPQYKLAKSITKTCIFGKFQPTNEHAVCNPVCTVTGYEWTKFYDRDDPSVTGDHELRSLMRNPNVCAKPVSIDARVVGTNKDFRTTNEKVEILPSLGLKCLKKNNNNKCSDYKVRFCCDADECASSPCSSHGTCTNTDGSFRCSCNTGYTGDGFSCRDVNECTEVSGFCGNGASCTNTPGGASCSCPAGTTGNPKVECTAIDVDECATDTDNCHAQATCQNTIGSFTCTCKSGYTGDGTQCTRITCPKPTPPENGKIIFGKSSYKPGDSLIFSCNDHYVHDYAKHGFPRYKCGNNGEWSGSKLVCEGSCRYACSSHSIHLLRGSPPCGCDPSCKENGTCCADYTQNCETCSFGCQDKPGCKCSNCLGDCCKNYKQACLYPNPVPTFSFPPKPTFTFPPRPTISYPFPTGSFTFPPFTPPGKK